MMAVKTTGMSLSGGAAAFATFALAALCAFGDNPPPCNPQPVVKPVKVVRREIKVAIIGEERMFKPKDLKWNVQEVIDYWYEAMDREIGNKPDLVVLPEGIDNWRDVTPAEKREWEKLSGAKAGESAEAKPRRRRKDEGPQERDLLRRDLRHSVAAYESWHMTDADEFSVIDCLPARGFVTSLTNDLRIMRTKYAETVPSPINVSNTLSVARIYSNREDYLEAAGDDMQWSAAYWNPGRRELVAYLPVQGEQQLLRTIRHEAFHQYLSYACSMMSAAPWFNEGYAQYFEDVDDADWRIAVTAEDLNRLEDMLLPLVLMDYSQFYDGTDAERRLKYRLAWSIAFFIENGAPKVRFRPFENLKKDYIETLLKTRDMRKATGAAFGSVDKFKNFVSEWKKFWLRRGL